MKEAKYTIADIQYKDGIYLVSVKIIAGEYQFNKAFKLQPLNGKIDMKHFEEIIRRAIKEEVKLRDAIAPVQKIKDIEQKIEL